MITIQREYDDDDYFFVIGEIVKVTSTEVWFKDFNVNGTWNSKVSIIPFDIITTIRFNSRYINTWAKYINKDRKVGN